MRAIIHNPQVCFLDEPSKSLDPMTGRRARTYLKKYAQDHGMTLVITTHNMLEAEEVCDRLALIDHGTVKFIGTSSEFKKRVTVKERWRLALIISAKSWSLTFWRCLV
jgi:ABC-2 type transport system ATP-binding protein